jgi:endoglucanase
VFELLVEVALARPNLAAGAGLAQNTTGWKGQMEGYLDKIVDGTSRGYLTKGEQIPDCGGANAQTRVVGGLLYFEGDSNQASLNPALNVAMLMSRYAPLATTVDKRDAYQVSSPKQRYVVVWSLIPP